MGGRKGRRRRKVPRRAARARRRRRKRRVEMGESNLHGLLFVNRRASSTEAKKGLHEDKSLRARSEEVLVLYILGRTRECRSYGRYSSSSSSMGRRVARMMNMGQKSLTLTEISVMYTMHTLSREAPLLHSRNKPKLQYQSLHHVFWTKAKHHHQRQFGRENLCLSSTGNVVFVLYGYTLGLLTVSSHSILF